MQSMSFDRSRALFEQAGRVIPGSVHVGGTPLFPPGQAPIYFERGNGCRIWDVDANEYIDYIMAYGAILLGYANREVDDAAFEQVRRGKLLSLNHPLHQKFMEEVLARFPAAEMGFFMKTGSEATTAAVRIARRFTGRHKLVRCGFHGWHDWCFPDDGSVPAGLAGQVLKLADIGAEGLQPILSANRGQVAAVIVAPETVLPLAREPLQAMLDIAHRHGALFILDEVKTACRAPGGSIQRHLDIAPDITTLSKGLGNGWPVSAVIGRAEVMRAGEDIHLSATYHGDSAAVAAALACMQIIDREDVPAYVDRLGQRLIDGLNAVVTRHGAPARAYPEPIAAMPFLAFTHPDQATNEALRRAFYGAMFGQGILLHPRHLWYTTLAHTVDDIDRTVAAADRAMGLACVQLAD
ncbi:MAG: aminotransferase class III-fold pyridoxal phosphate-dependent enzyme [Massilia sp.]